MRLPIPATRAWSISRAFRGALLPARARASWPRVIDAASWPRAMSVGPPGPAEPPRISHSQVAPVGKRDPEPFVFLQRLVTGVTQFGHPWRAIHNQPPAHTEAQREDEAGLPVWARGIQEKDLAPPASG